ncbi:MAG: hypothetical protein LBE74_09620 [Treponema sp.]|jgi:hypothetical protein|nr:hypothetical protein [Treponema sp.]
MDSVFESLIPIIVFMVIAQWLIISFLGRWVAGEKGYSTGAWFWLCLLFGVVALIAICGAPNKLSEYRLKELNRKFSSPSSESSQTNIVPSTANPVRGDFWVCKECGTKNRASESACNGCGRYK